MRKFNSCQSPCSSYFVLTGKLPLLMERGIRMKKKELQIVEGSIFKNLILFTVPIILTGLLQLLYNAADVIVVGRYAGSNSLAAVGSTSSLMNLFVNMFIGLSSGSAVCVARAIGARDEDSTHKSVHTSMTIAVIGGIFLICIGIPLSKDLLLMMHTPDEIIDEAAIYMNIIFLGMPASLVYNFGAAIVRSSGDAKTPMTILGVSGIVNIVLNLVFVIVFKRKADGVAYATIISQYISAAWIVIYLMRLDSACKLHLSKLRVHKAILFKILKIGVPAGIQGAIFSISNITIQSSINGFGADAVAGSSVASNIEGFVYTAMNSMYQSVLTFTGQNVGANRFDRVKRIIAIGCVQVTMIGLIAEAAVFIFQKQLINLYVPDAPEVMSYGILRLKYVVSLYFFCGIMDTLVGGLRGMGSSFLPMLASILGVCGIRIVWIYTVFKKFRTLEILFVSYPISWIATALFHFAFTIYLYRKLTKQTSTDYGNSVSV